MHATSNVLTIPTPAFTYIFGTRLDNIWLDSNKPYLYLLGFIIDGDHKTDGRVLSHPERLQELSALGVHFYPGQ
jgi:hypothetical protein